MGCYRLQRSTNGQFFFNLFADNNERILTSETYTTKGAAIGGIASVRENSPLDAQYSRLTGTNGQFYFTLKAKNHEVIGKSEMYTTQAARDNGIASCKTNGPASRVDDATGV